MVCDNNVLKIKLNRNNKSKSNPHIHVYFTQYRPKFKEYINHFKDIKLSNYKYNKKDHILKFSRNNIYLNNKILSDEMQYILDRKEYKNKSLGNSLDKPSLLLNQQYIRDTTTEIKIGKQGRVFDDIESLMDCKMCYDRDRDRYELRGENLLIDEREFITNYDFICIPPLIKENLTPDENGEITIKDINIKDYSYAQIFYFDEFSFCEKYLFLNNKNKTKLRDLRVVNDFDLNKNYCELRKIYFLTNNNKENIHYIKNINSVNYKIFNSIEAYLEFLKVVNRDLEPEINEYNFLINFNNLKLNEKLEKITKYFSHEINIYLFHHNDFFNKYIYPILNDKCEKTFIDYFLLNDIQKINEYCIISRIKKLNTFEKCLLIYSIKNKNKSLAYSI